MAYTWSTFKNLVKSLASDGAINDTAAVMAVSHFVKSGITLQVDKDPALAAAYSQLWEAGKNKLLGYTITLNDADLRTAVDKLLTVDATRHGIYEAGGFIDTLIAQAKNDIAGQATWYDNNIRQAVIELQHFIEFYRKGHETVYHPDDVVPDGESSVGQLPDGCQVQDAYYVKDGEPCTRMPIEQYDWQNRYDLKCGSPRMGTGRFYMALSPQGAQFTVFPMVLDDNYLSIHWDGTKLDFEDDDTVPFDEQMAEAVAAYLLMKMYIRPTSANGKIAAAHLEIYRSKRLQLYRTAKEKTGIRFKNSSPQPIPQNASCNTCAVAGDDENLIEFVAFGDSGESPLTNTEAVSALARAMEPDFVIHLGDTNYPSADPVTFQDQFYKYFSGMIRAEKFYQVWGNHDLESGESDGQWGKPLLDLLPHIAALNDGKLYYKFSAGDLNFFVYNTGFGDGDLREPDGVGVGSDQAAWLEEALGEASSGWNIVLLHKPPWTSDVNNTPGYDVVQALPFKDWGAHLLISGHSHNYERGITEDGLPWVNCGLGGATKRGFGTVTTGSQFRYNDKYGLLKCAGTATRLQVTFYNTDREPVDSLSIEREA